MEANTIIEVNGINYLITQKVVYNKTNYYMVAEMQGQKIVNSYGLIKEVLRDGKVIVDKVVDEKEQIQVYKLLIRDFSKDIEKVNLKNFIPIGEIVKIKDRDFALLDYIPMAKKMYMVFLTTSKPDFCKLTFALVVASITYLLSAAIALPVITNAIKAPSAKLLFNIFLDIKIYAFFLKIFYLLQNVVLSYDIL